MPQVPSIGTYQQQGYPVRGMEQPYHSQHQGYMSNRPHFTNNSVGPPGKQFPNYLDPRIPPIHSGLKPDERGQNPQSYPNIRNSNKTVLSNFSAAPYTGHGISQSRPKGNDPVCLLEDQHVELISGSSTPSVSLVSPEPTSQSNIAQTGQLRVDQQSLDSSGSVSLRSVSTNGEAHVILGNVSDKQVSFMEQQPIVSDPTMAKQDPYGTVSIGNDRVGTGNLEHELESSGIPEPVSSSYNGQQTVEVASETADGSVLLVESDVSTQRASSCESSPFRLPSLQKVPPDIQNLQTEIQSYATRP